MLVNRAAPPLPRWVEPSCLELPVPCAWLGFDSMPHFSLQHVTHQVFEQDVGEAALLPAPSQHEQREGQPAAVPLRQVSRSGWETQAHPILKPCLRAGCSIRHLLSRPASACSCRQVPCDLPPATSRQHADRVCWTAWMQLVWPR